MLMYRFSVEGEDNMLSTLMPSGICAHFSQLVDDCVT